jgi:hypothetical protein
MPQQLETLTVPMNFVTVPGSDNTSIVEYDSDDLVDIAIDYIYCDSGGEILEHTHQYNEDIWDEDVDKENEDDGIKNIFQSIGIPCKFAPVPNKALKLPKMTRTSLLSTADMNHATSWFVHVEAKRLL